MNEAYAHKAQQAVAALRQLPTDTLQNAVDGLRATIDGRMPKPPRLEGRRGTPDESVRGDMESLKNMYYWVRTGSVDDMDEYRQWLDFGRRTTKKMLKALPPDMLVHLVQGDTELGLAIAFFGGGAH